MGGESGTLHPNGSSHLNENAPFITPQNRHSFAQAPLLGVRTKGRGMKLGTIRNSRAPRAFILLLLTLLAGAAAATAHAGDITTIAGNGVASFSGDGGPALAASLNGPLGVAVAPDGTIYFGDAGNFRIRKVSPSGTISTVAGDGTPGEAATADRQRRLS